MLLKVKIAGHVVGLSLIMVLWQNCGKSNEFASTSPGKTTSASSIDDVEEPLKEPASPVNPNLSQCDQSQPGKCLVKWSVGYYSDVMASAKLHFAYEKSSLKRIICTKSDPNECLADLRQAMINYCGKRTAYFFTTPAEVTAFYKKHNLAPIDFSFLSPLFDEYISLQVSKTNVQTIRTGVNFLVCYNN